MIFLSLRVFVYCHKEFIAFDSEDEIVLMNANGEIKKKIKLPYKIIYDFCLKGDYVCFMGDDRKLHLLNWKKNKEVKLPAGPFIDINKSEIHNGVEYICGPEIYHNIDFSLENKMISCIVTPEFRTSKGNEYEEEDNIEYGFNELYNASDVGLIDFKNSKFIELAEQGDFHNSLIINNSVYFAGGERVIYKYNIHSKQKTENKSTDLIKGIKYGQGEIPYVCILGSYLNKLYFIIGDPHAYKNNINLCVGYLDVTSNKVVKLYGEFVAGFSEAARISNDAKKILDLKEENKIIIIYDFVTKIEKEIYHSSKEINRIQFYYD
jgi:hypothetical protein